MEGEGGLCSYNSAFPYLAKALSQNLKIAPQFSTRQTHSQLEFWNEGKVAGLLWCSSPLSTFFLYLSEGMSTELEIFGLIRHQTSKILWAHFRFEFQCARGWSYRPYTTGCTPNLTCIQLSTSQVHFFCLFTGRELSTIILPYLYKQRTRTSQALAFPTICRRPKNFQGNCNTAGCGWS